MPDGLQRPTVIDKLGFIKTVVGEQIGQNVDWIMFDHLGLARVQNLVPGPLRRPYAVFLHSIEAWNPLSLRRKCVLKGATVRIANSNYTAQRVASAHPDVGPIQVCHPALLPVTSVAGSRTFDNQSLAKGSPSSYSHLDSALLNRIQSNSVLIVGRMMSSERYKGHDQLIEAWPLVKGRVPDAQLLVVGSW